MKLKRFLIINVSEPQKVLDRRRARVASEALADYLRERGLQPTPDLRAQPDLSPRE